MADVRKPSEERLLVCVSARSSSAPQLNAAREMATGLGARWFAVYVEQPRMAMLPETARTTASDNLKLAADLGAETVTLTGRDVAAEIARFARERSVSRIFVGRPTAARSTVARLLRATEHADVYVVSGERAEVREPAYAIRPQRINLADYSASALYLLAATAICFAMYPYFDLSNLIMVYLLGVTLTAVECGRGPAMLSSLLSVLAFDVFFVPPRFSLTVEEAQYVVTFAVMCVVGLVISHLAAGMRHQTMLARLQERQAAAMHGLSRQLASARGVKEILAIAVRYVGEIFDGETLGMLLDEQRKLEVAAGDVSSVMERDVVNQMNLARSAYDSGRMTGWGTGSSPATQVLYVPLRAAHLTAGVLALRPKDPGRFLLKEQVELLESLAKQVALALEVELVSSRRTSYRGLTA
jgi:two-component system sensor histidine kinase KdpD